MASAVLLTLPLTWPRGRSSPTYASSPQRHFRDLEGGQTPVCTAPVGGIRVMALSHNAVQSSASNSGLSINLMYTVRIICSLYS